MRIVIVGKERDFAALRARLIDRDASPETARRAREALKAANPHVDLNRLRPGTLLLVPDRAEFAAADAVRLATPATRGFEKELRRGLRALRGRIDQSVKRNAEQRNAAAAMLKSRPIKKLTETDEELRRDVESVQEAMKAEAKSEAARLETFERLRAQLEQDLRRLQARFE